MSKCPECFLLDDARLNPEYKLVCNPPWSCVQVRLAVMTIALTKPGMADRIREIGERFAARIRAAHEN